jgi:alpha-L-rhamnosidase
MKKITSLFVLSFLVLTSLAQVKIQNLTTENLINPLGLDVVKPHFSWQLNSEKRNVTQSAYEIRISDDKQTITKANVWSSGKVMSDQSVHIIYSGLELKPMHRYFWQIRVWDNTGKPSSWSEIAYWETGLLNASNWKAKWIESGLENDQVAGPSPLLRRNFNIKKPVQSARVYITAHGLYEAQINGQRVGDAYLTPGWTSYKTRLQYQVYDVTHSVRQGSNALGVQLGDGWYRGYIAWQDNKNFYGKDVALLLQLEITYSDGTSETIISDENWKASYGPLQSSQIYHGEIYDARLEKKDWTLASFNDSDWKPVKLSPATKDNIIAAESPVVRKKEVFNPIKIIKTPKGETVLDFGQNLTGWIQMKVKGKAGEKITIQHAEVLDKQGNFYITNLRAAKAQIEYTLKGDEEETYEPHFTFFGFRYIKVEGFPGELTAQNFKAFAVYSDMGVTGNFECSNPLVNQLQHNIQWGQRGNFLDVPTDCPQRDERLGWTGDAQAFSRAATFNMNVEQFFIKWMKDIAADQLQNGAVPFVVPNVLGDEAVASTGWADAATIIPWNIYLAYGDQTILENQYESMKKWVSFMESKSVNNLWNTGFHFGDWLFYRPFDDNDGGSAVTDKYLIAQCFYANSVQLMINTARVLNKKEDMQRYSSLLKNIKDAFVKEYVTPNGRLVSGTQTAYVLALNFDMLPEELRKPTAQRLAENVKKYDDHLTTGFLGTPYLCHVLTRFGYDDVAYTLLLQEKYPSWLYPVKMGATTIWERWDGIKPDSTFQTPGMNSFNHYAYGAIGDWMYRSVAGLDTYENGAGYKHIHIQPHIDKRLTYAKAELQTPHGKTSSGWKSENGKLTLDVTVPANSIATIFVPAISVDKIMEGNKALSVVKDIKTGASENGYVILNVGSGNYHFVINQ